MLDDSYFMKQALIEAVKAGERGEVPVGAVVVCKERIIARAHNLTETLNDVTAHAEMQAITAAACTDRALCKLQRAVPGEQGGCLAHLCQSLVDRES